MFNVRTALQNNDVLLEDGEGGSYSDNDLSSDDGGDVMTGNAVLLISSTRSTMRGRLLER